MDFGAFVDLGSGVDGLLHVSQVAWGRVKHPSDVLKEGQTIKVRVEKVDPDHRQDQPGLSRPAGKPLDRRPRRNIRPTASSSGTVTKLMEFGAFVELEPGIEGLVHISELSHKRVWRPSDVVKEGEQVEVLVLSIDPEAQRISLSMKALAAPPEPAKKEGDRRKRRRPSRRRSTTSPPARCWAAWAARTGERFGLKW